MTPNDTQTSVTITITLQRDLLERMHKAWPTRHPAFAGSPGTRYSDESVVVIAVAYALMRREQVKDREGSV